MIPPIASRFVAGETVPEALEHAREANERGVGVILNLLGEHYHEGGPADEDAAAYCHLIDDLAETDLRACVSVKPSQLGLDVGEDVFRENLASVVERADEHGEFVWIDMEDHTTTDATLDAFEYHARETGGADRREAPAKDRAGSEATRETADADRREAPAKDRAGSEATRETADADRREAPAKDRAGSEATRETGASVGVCVQANLKRTREDLERLADLPGKVRLVKGAYDPPAEVAYREKSRVNEEYRDLLEFMFRAFDDGVAVGSHDPEMIDLAADLHDEHGTPYEVQMLMGVREDAQVALTDDCEVWQYAPYGSKWLSYFYRRVLERKENLTFALRAVVSG
ncbi:proline dehydrogenase family protein [Halosimplex sp. TS25]|uniref:proline dehydrogenase family protein n=1 Tax=Halosimplex rarum TaxID=3396619 RepID=UPI0039EA0EA9